MNILFYHSQPVVEYVYSTDFPTIFVIAPLIFVCAIVAICLTTLTKSWLTVILSLCFSTFAIGAIVWSIMNFNIINQPQIDSEKINKNVQSFQSWVAEDYGLNLDENQIKQLTDSVGTVKKMDKDYVFGKTDILLPNTETTKNVTLLYRAGEWTLAEYDGETFTQIPTK